MTPDIIAALLILQARLVSVTPTALAMVHTREKIAPWIIPLLTWTGARGGVSIALALASRRGPQKTLIVMATYVIVLFSVFAQSMTILWLLRRLRLEVRAK